MEYKEAIRKLAYAIAQVLKTVPPKQQKRAAVYLAPDFKPASEKLRASLQHHFDVLPENPMELPGLSPEEFQQSLERDFARCFVSIHPLNDAPFAKPVVEKQLDFARTQSKPRLVWTADRPDDLTNAGFEWFTSQAEIEDRVRRLYEKPPETKSTTAERLIYFLCPDRANKTQAEPLLEVLERRGVHVYPSPLDGPADQAMKTHVSALDELDGCLIYYGNVDRDWFDAVFLRVQKKIRQRGLLSGIFLAPPPTPHKTQDLRSVGVPLVDRGRSRRQSVPRCGFRSDAMNGAAAVETRPYIGLRYFEERDAHLFYGRDEHVTELLAKVAQNRFVAVMGSSGCGKSSLVRAGLLPELRSGMIPKAGPRWKVVEFRPGNAPLRELAEAIRSELGVEQAQALVEEGPLGIARAIAEAKLDEGTNVLVIADQFEEVFRYQREESTQGKRGRSGRAVPRADAAAAGCGFAAGAADLCAAGDALGLPRRVRAVPRSPRTNE